MENMGLLEWLTGIDKVLRKLEDKNQQEILQRLDGEKHRELLARFDAVQRKLEELPNKEDLKSTSTATAELVVAEIQRLNSLIPRLEKSVPKTLFERKVLRESRAHRRNLLVSAILNSINSMTERGLTVNGLTLENQIVADKIPCSRSTLYRYLDKMERGGMIVKENGEYKLPQVTLDKPTETLESEG